MPPKKKTSEPDDDVPLTAFPPTTMPPVTPLNAVKLVPPVRRESRLPATTPFVELLPVQLKLASAPPLFDAAAKTFSIIRVPLQPPSGAGGLALTWIASELS